MLRIVILTLICISICCVFAGDSYQESKPGNEKRKSEVSSSYHVIKHRRKPSHSRTKRKSLIIIRIREALWRKLNILNPYLESMKSIAFQKRSKEMLLYQRANHADQKQHPQKINMRVMTSLSMKSHLLSQNVFLQWYNLPAREKN